MVNIDELEEGMAVLVYWHSYEGGPVFQTYGVISHISEYGDNFTLYTNDDQTEEDMIRVEGIVKLEIQ